MAATTIDISQLRQQLSEVIKRAAAGEVVEVTEHGRPMARIVSAAPHSSRRDALIAQGIVTPGGGDLLETARRLGLPRPLGPGERTLSEALAELR